MCTPMKLRFVAKIEFDLFVICKTPESNEVILAMSGVHERFPVWNNQEFLLLSSYSLFLPAFY